MTERYFVGLVNGYNSIIDSEEQKYMPNRQATGPAFNFTKLLNDASRSYDDSTWNMIMPEDRIERILAEPVENAVTYPITISDDKGNEIVVDEDSITIPSTFDAKLEHRSIISRIHEIYTQMYANTK